MQSLKIQRMESSIPLKSISFAIQFSCNSIIANMEHAYIFNNLHYLHFKDFKYAKTTLTDSRIFLIARIFPGNI